MGSQIFSHTLDPDLVLSVLTSHLPNSLPLLRRLQFMNLPGGRTVNSHILASFSTVTPAEDESFVVAYLDLSRGPETEMWMYSSYENPGLRQNANQAESKILQMIEHVKDVAKKYEETEKRETPGIVLIGTLEEKVLKFLKAKGMVSQMTIPHFKFIFRKKDLPVQKDLPTGMEWGVVREEDLKLVLSRTQIPRKVRTMKLLPSAAVRIAGSDDPVAWGFLGPDGSLTTLHCEEAYRGKGLAKAVALKLFNERMTAYGHDGHVHADVATENLASQGVCKSLGGTVEWIDYWVWVNL